MKIFCWVKQIIKRFIYDKTIRLFNTSDYYGSAMGRRKREIRHSASLQWTPFWPWNILRGRCLLDHPLEVLIWHYFPPTTETFSFSYEKEDNAVGRGMDSGATLLVLKFCDLLWALGQVTWPLVACFYISRVGIIVVPS